MKDPKTPYCSWKFPWSRRSIAPKVDNLGARSKKKISGPDIEKYSLYVLKSIQSTNINSAGKKWNFFMFNLVVRKVTTRLYKVNSASIYNFSCRYRNASSSHIAVVRVAVLCTSTETSRGINNPTEEKNKKHIRIRCSWVKSHKDNTESPLSCPYGNFHSVLSAVSVTIRILIFPWFLETRQR